MCCISAAVWKLDPLLLGARGMCACSTLMNQGHVGRPTPHNGKARIHYYITLFKLDNPQFQCYSCVWLVEFLALYQHFDLSFKSTIKNCAQNCEYFYMLLALLVSIFHNFKAGMPNQPFRAPVDLIYDLIWTPPVYKGIFFFWAWYILGNNWVAFVVFFFCYLMWVFFQTLFQELRTFRVAVTC